MWKYSSRTTPEVQPYFDDGGHLSPATEVGPWLETLRRSIAATPKIGAVLDLVAKQPRLASYGSTAEVAKKAGVNTATVVRAAQILGFEGWLTFRNEIRSRYLASLTATEISAQHSERSENPASSSVVQDSANIALFARGVDLDAVERFASSIHRADATTVISTGSYTAVAAPLAHLGKVMGYPISLETRGGTHLANALATMTSDSCLVIASFWRQHAETVRAARVARSRGATVCVITDLASTPLARLAAETLVVPSEGSSWFPSMTAGVSAVNAILASLESHGGESVRDSIRNIESVWNDLDLYDQI